MNAKAKVLFFIPFILLGLPFVTNAELVVNSSNPGVVDDTVSGLSWYRDLSDFTLKNFYEQQAFVDQLNAMNYGNSSQWHLATQAEFFTIAPFMQTPNATDAEKDQSINPIASTFIPAYIIPRGDSNELVFNGRLRVLPFDTIASIFSEFETYDTNGSFSSYGQGYGLFDIPTWAAWNVGAWVCTPTIFVPELPGADAGENIRLGSDSLPATIIHGTATDRDANALLSYRWREGQIILLDWTPAGANGDCPFSLNTIWFLTGTHTLTLEVSDGKTSVSDDMILTIDNSAPQAAPIGAGKYEFGSPVNLGGQVSDYDGDTLTFAWFDGEALLFSDKVATIPDGTPVQLPNFSISSLSMGEHTITLEVTDSINPAVSSAFSVAIIDDIAPTLNPVSNKTILWPPNHKMFDVILQANASDNSGFMPTLSASVSSNEPIDDAAGDWTQPVIDQATGTITLKLRADRSGRGSGRTYTIVITATDAHGNSSTAKVNVVVPHDQRKQ